MYHVFGISADHIGQILFKEDLVLILCLLRFQNMLILFAFATLADFATAKDEIWVVIKSPVTTALSGRFKQWG